MRRRRSAGGVRGSGRNEVSGLAATATTTAVIEAAEKEVAVKVGWLESSKPSNSRHRGEKGHPTRLHRVAVEEVLAPPTGHILGSFGKHR